MTDVFVVVADTEDGDIDVTVYDKKDLAEYITDRWESFGIGHIKIHKCNIQSDDDWPDKGMSLKHAPFVDEVEHELNEPFCPFDCSVCHEECYLARRDGRPEDQCKRCEEANK